MSFVSPPSDLVIPVSSDRHTHTLLGALLSLRHMIPHLAITETADQSLKGSFGVMTSEKEVKVSSGYVLQVGISLFDLMT